MNVICPFVPGKLRSETIVVMESVKADFVDVSKDDEAYWRLLRDLWKAQGKFILVEHDVVPTPAILQALWACPRPWCAAPYAGPGGAELTSSLGCTKFSGRLMKRYPKLMERVGEIGNDSDDVPAKSWRRMDARLSLVMAEATGLPNGEARPHLHKPAVRHLNPNSL